VATYVDSSVVLADLLKEARRPQPEFWGQTLYASRLTEYEVWVTMHSRRRAAEAAGRAELVLDLIHFLEMTPATLDRVKLPFPASLRTLDALHLASADWLRREGFTVEFATYDARLRQAALVMGFPVVEIV
jgi:uncharacterized protein